MKKKFSELQDSNKLGYACLVLILSVLIIQSSVSLFIETAPGSSLESMDIVIRSTLSSIFGFIVATSSMSAKKNKKENEVSASGNIGFDKEANDQKMKMSNQQENVKDSSIETKNTSKPNKIVSNTTQIILLTLICLYCLGTIIFVRNIGVDYVKNSSAVAIISQFREFISATIGALIGITKGSAD